MEHLVPSINKFACIFLLFFIRCDSGNKLVIPQEAKEFDAFKKQATYKGEVFSGFVYNTNKSGDTVLNGEYKNGAKHGVWEKFYTSGALKERRLYKKGLKVGFYEGFYNDGAKNFVFQFKNGEYDGTNRVWAKGGVLIEETTFSAGYENGVQKRWYLNGKIKSNYIIKDNRRYGLLGTKNCVTVSDSLKKS